MSIKYNLQITRFLDDLWTKRTKNKYYLTLEKDGEFKKFALETGKLVSKGKVTDLEAKNK